MYSPSYQNLVNRLIGKTAKADHPITALNPTETFVIVEAKIEDGRTIVRGENTCWFGEKSIKNLEG